MKQKLYLLVGMLALGFCAGRLQAQTLSVEFSQNGAPLNLQSLRGVPISGITNTPPGSDGKQPTAGQNASGSGLPATTNQFRALIAFGGVTAATNQFKLTNSAALQMGNQAFSVAVAVAMQVPIVQDHNGVYMILRRAQIGAPYLGQQVSYSFGSVIPAPATDENGQVLSSNVVSAYWQGEPYIASSQTNNYYYSPNAGVVFASVPGPITITWATESSYPANQSTNWFSYTNELGIVGNTVVYPSFYTNGSQTYRLYTANYYVSSSPYKPPQDIYWTESTFQALGYPVSLPQGRVSAIHVAYYGGFPATVTNIYQDPNSSPGVGQTNTENRTLWLNTLVSPNQIHAFNVQGLVFVELLGQPNSGGSSRQYLGNEIVNVTEAATPLPVTINLGEELTPFQDGWEGTVPDPSPIANNLGTQYYYSLATSDGTTLYADKLTTDTNDLQVYWLTTGVAGLEWPDQLDNYDLIWPVDPAAYSHYLRPLVATPAEAAQTAVTLDGNESPSIDYQDPLDMPRAFLTSSNTFYTFLSTNEPAQRALLRFNAAGSVRFERVFSWLENGIETNSLLAGSVATNLDEWSTNNGGMLSYSNLFAVPYVTQMTVAVGDRISAPPNELGSTGDYWAGWINPAVGNSYNPAAYLNPFANGFALANSGSIIPVNAIPGNNELEVLWFRQNNANPASGFQIVYWPSVIGHYTIQWPVGGKQIILAGNEGSGTLQGAEGESDIYYQNDPTQVGYNPNEEHALMLGSTVYALRNDLNVTNGTNPSLPFNGYSSAPYVLLEYLDDDGRPSMDTFLVRREAPENGVYFDYPVPAGTKLQPPMPLGFMSAPTAPNTNYLSGITNYDSEPSAADGDLPPGWQPGMAFTTPYGNYPSFTFQDRQNSFWVYRGPHAGLPAFQGGYYDVTNNTFTSLPVATAVTGSSFLYYIQVSRLLESLGYTNTSPLPAGLSMIETNNSIAIAGVPTATVPSTNTTTLQIFDNGDLNISNQPNTLTLSLTIIVVTNVTVGTAVFSVGPSVISATNTYSGEVETFTNQVPALALAATPTNSFAMHFYYKTLPGFAWPELGNATNWPAIGSIVPYLLPVTNGLVTGDPTSSNTPSLNVVYRPIWPELQADGYPLPNLELGQTLTVPNNGVAAIRGQDSAQILYQQSIAKNITQAPASVVLYDPTVEKKVSLPQYLNYNFTGQNGLPASTLADSYEGLLYFPNLPPNLVSRFWFDPGTTNLVLEGQFVDLGDPAKDYLLPNILSPADLAALDGLCTPVDQNYAHWTNAMANLSANVYTFSPNPLIPGSYVINNRLTTNYLATQTVAISSPDSAVDSYAMCAKGPGEGYVSYLVGNSGNPKYASDTVLLYIARVTPPLYPGSAAVVNQANASPLGQSISFQHSSDLAGDLGDYQFDWEITAPLNNGNPNTNGWLPAPNSTGGPTYTLGSTGVQGLSDNYVEVRYRCTNLMADPAVTNWSAYTPPTFAPGWITRVLDAVNPFQQRTTDLFNNPVNTTASLISQAGPAWNGDIPLNEASLTNAGLIQIYQTVLDVGKSLTIEASPPNGYGPACDALLQAAGSISDLYMVIGNDAWANSLNPTIGFGTTDTTYGAIATSQFVFEGQEPSLLEQNLALLRGRNDTIPEPGVDQYPVFNRLFWNYTYGIDAGSVIYALNYNITDQNGDGLVNAADAAIMYPQGHGDAYGHYLTAMTSYYELLMNTNFQWVPFSSPVTLAGSADTVLVNYEYERKFATAAAAVFRAGRQVFDLTWREDYQPGTVNGWTYFATNYFGGNTWTDTQNQTHDLTGYWGMDHWAARVGQGGYLNWVVVNSLLPPVDTNPNDQGIQKVDRTTVPELSELPQMAAALENDMDNANAGFTPLGLSQNSIPFDINPQQVTGSNPQTHFEQIYARAVQALNNAVVAFDDAQNITQEMREEQNSLSDYQAGVTAQELAFNNQLIAIYGTPYPDDIGPGQTYPQGYTGPDLVHYMYVDDPNTNTFGGILPDPTVASTNYLYIGNLPSDWATTMYENFDFYTNSLAENYDENTNYIPFVIGPDGFTKPASWTSERVTPGSIQTAISTLVAAQDKLRQAVAGAASDKLALDKSVAAFNSQTVNNQDILSDENGGQGAQFAVDVIQNAQSVAAQVFVNLNNQVSQLQTLLEYTPTEFIVGTADGGDEVKAALLPAFISSFIAQDSIQTANIVTTTAASVAITAAQAAALGLSVDLNNNTFEVNQENAVLALGQQLGTLQGDFTTINEDQRALSDAQTAYQQQVASGNAIQQQRLTFRQQEAAVVSGYSTRNAAYLIFQNEKLTRYTSLFNLAAQYSYMAANAYDYETGLLDTPAGQAFLNQIISSCALGVVENGEPQISGTDTGDPGLANALAEMDADWSVLKGRLGFNNPDGYGTTVSLRTENYRINPDATGNNNWKQVLQAGLMPDLTADTDVRQHCLQIGDGSGAAVPGIELSFGTTITDGENLFGQPLGPGDHAYSSSSFATKIFSVGVCFDGYEGMDNPVANSGTGGTSPGDPTLDANALAATPYVYLIPCGADTMRSPPLGDTSTIRTWDINDVAIPLPFNISESDFSTTPFYTASDSLTEPLFAVRKQEAFRPVSTTAAFNTSIYGADGSLAPSQYSNERLIGRSVWNTKWKLVIPGYTLLADPNQGLSRFINSVTDVHLYFITYSYAGN